MKTIFKQKTTWAGIAGIVAALGGFLTGELSIMQALVAVIPSMVGLFAPDITTNAPQIDPTLPKP